jgi:hypothetical protein
MHYEFTANTEAHVSVAVDAAAEQVLFVVSSLAIFSNDRAHKRLSHQQRASPVHAFNV